MTAIRRKKRIAFFDFACCEGCQLAVLELGETLLELLDHVHIAAWREVMTGGGPPYDAAFCEGSIASRADARRLQRIRREADVLVALGSCAAGGCHNTLRNRLDRQQSLEAVYGSAGEDIDSTPARPVDAVVEVDYRVWGCPASLPEFTAVFQAIVLEQPYRSPTEPVCVECKANDILCVYELGRVCLGPLTRCGCNAVCTRYGDVCHGCRGPAADANLAALPRVFARHRHHPIIAAAARRNPLDKAAARRRLAIYSRDPEPALEDRQDERT